MTRNVSVVSAIFLICVLLSSFTILDVQHHLVKEGMVRFEDVVGNDNDSMTCLLYTLDAADDLPWLCLGGCGIIKYQLRLITLS